MALVALALYGSWARDDAGPQSDIDLLGVTRGERRSSSRAGKASLYLYPERLLLSQAKSGNLFVMHLVLEAKFLYDLVNFEGSLHLHFKRKANYVATAQKAADAGWFMCDYGPQFVNTGAAARRAGWCARTILVSKSVDDNRPTFSATGLELFDRSGFAGPLLSRGRSSKFDEVAVFRLSSFLTANGYSRPINDSSIDSYVDLFQESNNKIGQQFVESFLKQVGEEPDY